MKCCKGTITFLWCKQVPAPDAQRVAEVIIMDVLPHSVLYPSPGLFDHLQPHTESPGWQLKIPPVRDNVCVCVLWQNERGCWESHRKLHADSTRCEHPHTHRPHTCGSQGNIYPPSPRPPLSIQQGKSEIRTTAVFLRLSSPPSSPPVA